MTSTSYSGYASSNAGSSTSKSPESWVEVVDARTSFVALTVGVDGSVGVAVSTFLAHPANESASTTASTMPAARLKAGALLRPVI